MASETPGKRSNGLVVPFRPQSFDPLDFINPGVTARVMGQATAPATAGCFDGIEPSARNPGRLLAWRVLENITEPQWARLAHKKTRGRIAPGFLTLLASN
jgi:hypothetical protein